MSTVIILYFLFFRHHDTVLCSFRIGTRTQLTADMVHIGTDLQTWALFMSAGSCFWWPLCFGIGRVYGYGTCLPLCALLLALPHIPMPQRCIDATLAAVKHQLPAVYMEPPAPPGAAPEVILLLPHGLIGLECLAVYKQWLLAQQIHTSMVFIDKLAQVFLPGITVVFRMFAIPNGILKHRNIEQQMQARHTVAALPGGFGDAVAGTAQEQLVFLGTTSYWLRQCQKHGYALRILHVYNGSDMVQQSAVGLRWRARLAHRFHVPILLPTAINTVSSLVTRCVVYSPEALPTPTGIQRDLERYVALDKLSPIFPAPQRRYTILARL